jgi:hypothetical protein
MVQIVGLDLPASHLASLDFDNYYWFVLRSSIPCGGSPLAFGE